MFVVIEVLHLNKRTKLQVVFMCLQQENSDILWLVHIHFLNGLVC